jgi:hypothetical protein
MGDFDEAFGSRIHISLHYPQLELDATKEIFELNLRLTRQRFEDKNRKLEIQHELIMKSAEKYWWNQKKMRWNGRQIRNACQTALALAEFNAQGGIHERIVDKDAIVKLTADHLETVSASYLEFMRYLEKLYKKNQDRLAHKRGYRARELNGKRTHKGKASSKPDDLDSMHDDDSDGDMLGEETDPMFKGAPVIGSSFSPGTITLSSCGSARDRCSRSTGRKFGIYNRTST